METVAGVTNTVMKWRHGQYGLDDLLGKTEVAPVLMEKDRGVEGVWCGQLSLDIGKGFSEASLKRGRLTRRRPGKDSKSAEGQGAKTPWDQNVLPYRSCRRPGWLSFLSPRKFLAENF